MLIGTLRQGVNKVLTRWGKKNRYTLHVIDSQVI